jgi:hypothetical protein
MSAERDMTRIVRSWLRVDEHESADRVLDNVFALLDATPQRPAWWPARRIADMNTFAKLTIAAAAVLVLAVVGINLLPRSGGNVGGPAATPAPSPTLSPSPEPSTSPAAFPPAGELAVGRHSMTRNGIRLSVTLPTSGWQSNQGFFLEKSVGTTPEGASLLFWDANPVGVYADPCTRKMAPPAGPSAADLASAVSTISGTDLVSGPSDVTVGGHPAKHVVITVREDVGCVAESFYLWYAPPEGEARYITQLGATMRVWIIDVDGTIVWIDGETYKGAGPEPGQEIQQIVDSIQFE